MSHTVYLRNLDIAPRKTRIVADTVRGLSVNEAEARLLMQTKRASGPILKLLRSAKAGAKAKEMDPDTLYIESIRVDQGPMLKRFMPRARGSASAIQKKMSHIILVLAENPHAKPSRFTIAEVKRRSRIRMPLLPAGARRPRTRKRATRSRPTRPRTPDSSSGPSAANPDSPNNLPLNAKPCTLYPALLWAKR